MLHDSTYDKIKLLHSLSCISWFIDKHARSNAQKAGDSDSLQLLDDLKADLEKNIEKLEGKVCK